MVNGNQQALRVLVAFAGFGGEEFLELVFGIDKVIGVWKRAFLRRYIRPFIRIIAVDLKPLFEIGFGIGFDGLNRAFRFAHPAIDAFIGMDDEHVLAFVETVDGADFDAVRIFALYAALVDDIRHSNVSDSRIADGMAAAGLSWTTSGRVRLSSIIMILAQASKRKRHSVRGFTI